MRLPKTALEATPAPFSALFDKLVEAISGHQSAAEILSEAKHLSKRISSKSLFRNIFRIIPRESIHVTR